MLENALTLGEQQLSAEFRDHVGEFWTIPETRPYMRTRLALIHALIAQGEHEDAIAHMEEMLRLNPTDDQHVRWLLLQWYCNMNWIDKAWRLLDEYKDEETPFIALTRILSENSRWPQRGIKFKAADSPRTKSQHRTKAA